MAEQIQSVEEPQTKQEDSTAATLAEFARLLYRVANDISYPDTADKADRKSRLPRES